VAGTGGILVDGTGGIVVTPGTGGAVAGTGGMIPLGCSPATCTDGCCAGDQCITQLSAQQCGHSGLACQPCGGCQRCSTTGTCELDPASQWTLTANSAVLNKADPHYPNGATGVWDGRSERYGGSLPDPFCQLEVPFGTPINWTSTIVDTLTPSWNQPLNPAGGTLTAADLLPNGMNWQIWVGDDDGNGFGEVMCEINAPLSPADFLAGGFTRTNVGSSGYPQPSCTSVTFTLTCQP
jgi:hypothetical protein